MNPNATAQMVALQQGTYGVGGNITDWSYYDTIKLNASVRSHTLFKTPLGQGNPSKTLADTNMVTNTIPQGQKFTAFAVKTFYVSADLSSEAKYLAFCQMLKNTTIEFFITGKDATFQYKMNELVQAPILAGLKPTTAGDNVNSIEQNSKGILPLNIPIVLAGLTSFEARIVHHVAVDSSLNNDEICISLNGRLDRSN